MLIELDQISIAEVDHFALLVTDVHALNYSDDAPALENALHKEFDCNRVHLVNTRKEFFNVTLNEIETQVKKITPHAKFVITAEAR